MQNKIHFKTIEDIAIQYIINTTNSENKFEDTINTIKDPKISIKGCNSIGGSFFCRTNKFYENENYIFFRKIPQKTLSDDELISFNTETEDSSSKNTIYNSNTVIKLSHTRILVKNCKNIKYTKKLFFPLKYDLVYDCLSELYLPLITNLEDLNNFRNYLFDTKKKVEYFSSHESIHEKNNLLENMILSSVSTSSRKNDEFFEEEKCCEIIEFSLILFIIHLMFGAKIQYTEIINEEDIETIYGEICFVLHKMLENIMLKLLFNENYNKINNKIKNDNKKKQSNSISFESVCSRYVKDYFKGMEKPQNKIINDLNTNLSIIFQRLYNAINILMFNFTKVKIYTKNVENPDEIETYFLNLLDYNNKSENNEINIDENDEEGNSNNSKDNVENENNKEKKEILQKEFIDQYECFKFMFYFLTKKDIKNNDNNINSENKKENNKNEKFRKHLLKNKNITPLKNGTYTSLNKLIESNMNENDKNQNTNNSKSKETDIKIKNNLTNSNKGNKINTINQPLITEKPLDEVNTSFYTKLKYYFNLYLSNFLSILERNKVKPPFLPKLDTNKYKYTLVLDLDETLVHYIEEENSAYVQVRPYADYFLKELSKYFEIVLFTAAEEDYTDIVLKELNKNNYISHVLCRKYTELNNNSYIKDLSKLGRDLSKVCIVDNNKDNFCLQPENGLFISSYYGEQNDNELYLLCGDLMKIIEIQPDDIRTVIKEIDIIMQRRYSENMYVVQ